MEKELTFKHGVKTMWEGIRETSIVIWKPIDKAAHVSPWYFIVTIVMICITISFYLVYQARTERDSSNKALYELEMKYDSLEACYSVSH